MDDELAEIEMRGDDRNSPTRNSTVAPATKRRSSALALISVVAVVVLIGGLIMGRATSDEITAMHLADRTAEGWMPWAAMTPTSELDPEKDYFCVCTWGTMWFWNAPQFGSYTGEVHSQLASLPPGQLIGKALSIQIGFKNFIAETITVWHEREHMASFFRSGTHQNAMLAMAHKIGFRARRIWVKGADLPSGGDSTATRAFVLRVKSAEFPEAVKAGHAAAAVAADPDKLH